MLDVGWSEILVIAVVLIVVVGPKDLPPMLRAFAKMSRKFTTMAGEFRKQFDDALNEADMGDLRKTISDVQRLNPVNSLRDAMNPLRQAAEDIRTDLKKTVEGSSSAATVETPVAVTLPEPAVSLDGTVPVIPQPEAKTLVPDTASVVTSTAALAERLPMAPVEEVIQVKPKTARKAKAVSVIDEVAPIMAPAKPRARKAAATSVVEEAVVTAAPKKTRATKKDKA
nr:Sec-independent protein translocase protein TatB [uncultured Gellertiella sp.]